MAKKSRRLLDFGQQIPLQTELAVLIGDRAAIALQQIHYWLSINEQINRVDTHYAEGRWWCYNTWNDWREKNFPFWSDRTLRRLFQSLEEQELIETRRHENDKLGKWVTINYDRLNELLEGDIDPEDDPGQNDHDGQKDQGKPAYPSQKGQGTSDTDINFKKVTTPPPAAQARGLKGYAPRGRQPKSGDAKVADPNEEAMAQFTPLVRKILSVARRTSLSQAQQDKLKRPVLDWNHPDDPALPSPHVLFESNPDFERYVEQRIRRMMELSEGKTAIDKIVNAICDYNKPYIGWLAWQKGTPLEPDIDYDRDIIGDIARAKEASKPILSGRIPGFVDPVAEFREDLEKYWKENGIVPNRSAD